MPSVETIRPSFIGYSVGWRSATRRPSRSNFGVSRPATRSTVARAISSASVSGPRMAVTSVRRKDREKPPTRTETGWIARPPIMATSWLPAFLRASPRFDRGAMILGQLERARVAEEVGQVEQVDVQGVALDPLAAVEQAAERPDGGVDLDAEAVLEGVDRGHLVGDRADAADAGDDVDDLVGRPADDQALEVARRLEDLEVRLLDDAVAGPAAGAIPRLRPGSARRCRRRSRRSWRACRCHASSVSRVRTRCPGGPPWESMTVRNEPDQAVKPENRRATSGPDRSSDSHRASEAVLADSRGPKQP